MTSVATEGRIALRAPATLSRDAISIVNECVAEMGAARTASDPVEVWAQVRTRAMNKLQSADAVLGALFVSALVDLSMQGWQVEVQGDDITLANPSVETNDAEAEKRRVRAGHLVERNRQLGQPAMRSFVAEMEETRLHKGRWVSVFSLMRDGHDLAAKLAGLTGTTDDGLGAIIDPYLQLVDATSQCEFTGLRLSDIWRYFRATWSTAYQSVPGRRMHVLVRDRAADNHPVIGIAALSSAVVQLRVRDEWIGWTPEQVFKSLSVAVKQDDATYFDGLLRDAIDAVYKEDFFEEGLLLRPEVAQPSAKTLSRLAKEAERSRRAHEAYPHAIDYKASGVPPEAVDWELQARSYLFRSKRAATLATLLKARQTLLAHGMHGPSKEGLRAVIASRAGRQALSALLRAAKARRVGIDMLDITTCGAVQPYAALLGGKLVSLLMFSREVIDAYQERYGKAVSLIASGMKGELVTREPRLVLLGTTSLYGVASSQYNRLKIPAQDMGGSAKHDLRYEALGRTEGFGSFHFSQETVDLGERIASQGRAGRRVNSIFGEGVNPRLRKLREALASAGFPTDRVLKHGSPRLVYGIPLAENFREVLLGKQSRPRYLVKTKRSADSTSLIAKHWRRRWLAPRILRPDVLEAVAANVLSFPVRHGARVPLVDAAEETHLFQFEF